MPNSLSKLFRFLEHESIPNDGQTMDNWIVSCGTYDEEYRIYRIMFKSHNNSELNVDEERIIPVDLQRARKSLFELIEAIYTILRSNAYQVDFKKACHRLLLEDPWIEDLMQTSHLTVSSFQSYSSSL